MLFFISVAMYNSFSSLKNPTSIFQTNVIGTINLPEAVKKVVPLAKVLLPGSAEQYGFVSDENMPIKESYPLNPVNPYAISKKHQEEIGLYYFIAVWLKFIFYKNIPLYRTLPASWFRLFRHC